MLGILYIGMWRDKVVQKRISNTNRSIYSIIRLRMFNDPKILCENQRPGI